MDRVHTTSGSNPTIHPFYHYVNTATDVSDYSIYTGNAWPGGIGGGQMALMCAWRGVTASSPIDVIATQNATSASSTAAYGWNINSQYAAGLWVLSAVFQHPHQSISLPGRSPRERVQF